jgi:N6-adenosine-specific RNA methylase IME4
MKFTTAIIDPPWKYDRASASAKLSGYVSQEGNEKYKTLSVQDLSILPVGEIVEKYVFLWCVGPFMQEGLDLLKAWGFEYKSQLCWVKDDKQLGVGFWFRGNHEFILVGKKPSALSVRTGVSSVHKHPRIGHSTKPDFLHLLLEKHFPGPYLELFGRRSREGWTVLGNEAPGDGQEIEVSLQNIIAQEAT